MSLEEVEILVRGVMGLPTDAFAAVWDPGLPAVHSFDQNPGANDGSIVAAATDNPDRGRLLGFFVEEELPDGDYQLSEMKRKLAKQMSEVQCPALLIPVQRRFPLTATGKVSWTPSSWIV